MIDERYLLKNEHYILDEFEFKNGSILENVDVDYGIVGTPKYDEKGNIINAILFSHGFEGNYSSISDFNQIIGNEDILSKDDYFFISITSLGFPESCSPSKTGLKHNFPAYEIEDLVNFKKQFLAEKFPNIKKLRGFIGYSFGGYEALAWSVFFPDEVDFIIHFLSSYKTTGYKYIFAKIANQIIENSPGYYSLHYDESTSNVLINISQLHYLISFTEDYFNKMSPMEIDVMMDNFTEDGLFYDIHDIKLRNDFLITYDLEAELDKVKSKVLIISSNKTAYYTLKHDSKPLHDILDDSTLLYLDIDEETDIYDSIYKISEDIKKFIDSV